MSRGEKKQNSQHNQYLSRKIILKSKGLDIESREDSIIPKQLLNLEHLKQS